MAKTEIEAEVEVNVAPAPKKGKSVTLQCDFMLFDATTGIRYHSGAVIEGEVPPFLVAQVNYGTAKLV